MSKLVWKVDDLRPLWEHAQAAPQHRPTFDQMVEYDPEWDFGEMSDEDANKAAQGPALHFVKDSGIYIMSNGLPIQEPKGERVAYAQGYDPTQGDVYDKCVNAVGGDDFVEVVTADFCEQMFALKSTKPGERFYLEIECTADQMSMGVVARIPSLLS